MIAMENLESHNKLSDFYTERSQRVIVWICQDLYLKSLSGYPMTFSFLSTNNNNKAVIICHFRPRDIIKLKSQSNDVEHRKRDASQNLSHQIHLVLLVSPFPKNTCRQRVALWAEPKVQNDECSHDWLKLIGSRLVFPQLWFCSVPDTDSLIK